MLGRISKFATQPIRSPGRRESVRLTRLANGGMTVLPELEIWQAQVGSRPRR